MEELYIPRVLIIGAGSSGLSLLRVFKVLEQKQGRAAAHLFCYQLQEDWLGQWNYEWRVGKDEHGYPIQNAMYQGLWANLCKEINEFPDYSFKEHFKGVNVSSYLPRAIWRSYLDQRFSRVSIKEKIRFKTAVRNVIFKENKDKFQAQMHDLRSDKHFSEEFDYVVVGTGHYSTPNYPYYPGFQSFNGNIIHAGNIRNWASYKDQRVLIIGAGPSSEDVSLQLYKHKAKSVTISFRTKPLRYKWPKNIQQLPCLTEVKLGNTALFNNGQQRQVDSIILCTGYLYSYPFMEESLKLKTNLRLYPPLYRSVVLLSNPKVFYIGSQKQVFSFLMYEMQAIIVRDIIAGKSKLPDMEEMKKDMEYWLGLQDSCKQILDVATFLAKQAKSLQLLSNFEHPNLELATEVAIKCIMDRFTDDIIYYRDNTFESSITGVISKPHPIRWIQNMDDSPEGFMKHFTTQPKI